MGAMACGLVANLIDWIDGPSSDYSCPRCPTEVVAETLRFFLREGVQWHELRATQFEKSRFGPGSGQRPAQSIRRCRCPRHPAIHDRGSPRPRTGCGGRRTGTAPAVGPGKVALIALGIMFSTRFGPGASVSTRKFGSPYIAVCSPPRCVAP